MDNKINYLWLRLFTLLLFMARYASPLCSRIWPIMILQSSFSAHKVTRYASYMSCYLIILSLLCQRKYHNRCLLSLSAATVTATAFFPSAVVVSLLHTSVCSAQSLVFVAMLISPEKCDKEMNLQFVMISRRIGRSCLYGTITDLNFILLMLLCVCVCVCVCFSVTMIVHLPYY